MIIECGDCLTKFVVAPEAIGPEGRMVRCAKCQHVWHADPAPEGHEIVPTEVIEKPEATPEPESGPESESPIDGGAAEPDMDSLTDGNDKLDVAEADDIQTDDEVGDDGIPGEDLDALGEDEQFEPIDEDDNLDNHDDDDDLDDVDDINLPAVVPVKSRLIKAAWGLWAVLMISTIATFGFAQGRVSTAWPASTVLYELVGMSDHGPAKSEQDRGGETKEAASDNVASETVKEPEISKGPTREELERAVVITNSFKIEAIGGGRRDLVIDGTLRNTASFDIALPQMKGVLKNSADENVHEWNFTTSDKIIKADSTLNFKTVVQRIPADTAAYELFLLWENNQ